MAKKIWGLTDEQKKQPILDNEDWGNLIRHNEGEEPSDGWEATGELVQKYVRDSLGNRFGFIVFYEKPKDEKEEAIKDKNLLGDHYLLFATELTYNAWKNPESEYYHDETLVLGYFSPAKTVGAQLNIKTLRLFDEKMILGKDNIFEYVYNATIGDDPVPTNGSIKVIINGEENKTLSKERSLINGNTYSINIGRYLTEAKKYNIRIIIYNDDKAFKVESDKSRTWDFEVEILSLQLAFTPTYISSLNVPKKFNDEGNTTFSKLKCTGAVPAKLYYSLDNGEYKEAETEIGGSEYELVVNQKSFPVKDVTKSTHNIRIYAKHKVYNNLISNILTSDFIFAGYGKNTILFGDKKPSKVILTEDAQFNYYIYLKPESTPVSSLSVTYSLKDNTNKTIMTFATAEIDIHYNETENYYTSDLINGKFNISDENIKGTGYKFAISVAYKDRNFSISQELEITAPDVIVKIKDDPKVNYDFNKFFSTSPEILEDKLAFTDKSSDYKTVFKRSENFKNINDLAKYGIQTDNNGVNYYCIPPHKRLILSGTYKNNPWYLFSDVDGNIGFTKPITGEKSGHGITIEMMFKTSEVNDTNGTFVSCIDKKNGQTGFKIFHNRVEFYVTGSNTPVKTYFKENELIHFILNINGDKVQTYDESQPPGKQYNEHTYGYLCINGVISRIFDYNFNPLIQEIPSNLEFGNDEGAFSLYFLRIYNNFSTIQEIINNFAYSGNNLSDKLERIAKNDIFDDEGNVDVTRDEITKEFIKMRKALPDTPIINFINDDIPAENDVTYPIEGTEFYNPSWDKLLTPEDREAYMQSMNGNSDACISYRANEHSWEIQGSSSAGYPRPYKNFSEGYDENATEMEITPIHTQVLKQNAEGKYEIGYAETGIGTFSICPGINCSGKTGEDWDIGDGTLVEKLNFASSEGIFNMLLENLYSDLLEDLVKGIDNKDLLTKMQYDYLESHRDNQILVNGLKKSILYRKSLCGFPMIGFQTFVKGTEKYEPGQSRFLSIYNMINDKSEGSIYGLTKKGMYTYTRPNDLHFAELWEIKENRCFFQTKFEYNTSKKSNNYIANGDYCNPGSNDPILKTWYARIPKKTIKLIDKFTEGDEKQKFGEPRPVFNSTITDKKVIESIPLFMECNTECVVLRRFHNWIWECNPHRPENSIKLYINGNQVADNYDNRISKFTAEYKRYLHVQDAIYYFVFHDWFLDVDGFDKNMSIMFDDTFKIHAHLVGGVNKKSDPELTPEKSWLQVLYNYEETAGKFTDDARNALLDWEIEKIDSRYDSASDLPAYHGDIEISGIDTFSNYLRENGFTKDHYQYIYENSDMKARFIARDMDSIAMYDNEGELTLNYWAEWNDRYDKTTGYVYPQDYRDPYHDSEEHTNVYNGYKSGLWDLVNIVFGNEIKTFYKKLRIAGLNYENIIKEYNKYRAQWCEALYNMDAQAYTNTGYISCAHGDKAEILKYFLSRKQDYYDSKYCVQEFPKVTRFRLYGKTRGVWFENYAPGYNSCVLGNPVGDDIITRRSYHIVEGKDKGKQLITEFPQEGNVNYVNANSSICYSNYIKNFGGYRKEGDSMVRCGIEGIGQVKFSMDTIKELSHCENFIMNYTSQNPNPYQAPEGLIGLKELKLLREIAITYCPSVSTDLGLQSELLKKVDFRGTPLGGFTLPADEDFLEELNLPSTISEIDLNNYAKLNTLNIDKNFVKAELLNVYPFNSLYTADSAEDESGNLYKIEVYDSNTGETTDEELISKSLLRINEGEYAGYYNIVTINYPENDDPTIDYSTKYINQELFDSGVKEKKFLSDKIDVYKYTSVVNSNIPNITISGCKDCDWCIENGLQTIFDLDLYIEENMKSSTSLELSDINWKNVEFEKFAKFVRLFESGNLKLHGQIELNLDNNRRQEQMKSLINDILPRLGYSASTEYSQSDVLNHKADLYIYSASDDETLYLEGPTEIIEGSQIAYTGYKLLRNTGIETTLVYQLDIDDSRIASIDSSTGVLTTNEGYISRDYTFKVLLTYTENGTVIGDTQTTSLNVMMKKVIYPSSLNKIQITGPISIIVGENDETLIYDIQLNEKEESKSSIVCVWDPTCTWGKPVRGDIKSFRGYYNSNVDKSTLPNTLKMTKQYVLKSGVASLELKVVLKHNYQGNLIPLFGNTDEASTLTLNIELKGADIAFGSDVNPRLWEQVSRYALTNPDYITIDECASISPSDLIINLDGMTEFNEWKYLTQYDKFVDLSKGGHFTISSVGMIKEMYLPNSLAQVDRDLMANFNSSLQKISSDEACSFKVIENNWLIDGNKKCIFFFNLFDKEIFIPEGIIQLEDYLFNGRQENTHLPCCNTSIEKIHFPDSLTTIGGSVFNFQLNIKKYYLNNISKITGLTVFKHNNITDFYIGYKGVDEDGNLIPATRKHVTMEVSYSPKQFGLFENSTIENIYVNGDFADNIYKEDGFFMVNNLILGIAKNAIKYENDEIILELPKEAEYTSRACYVGEAKITYVIVNKNLKQMYEMDLSNVNATTVEFEKRDSGNEKIIIGRLNNDLALNLHNCTRLTLNNAKIYLTAGTQTSDALIQMMKKYINNDSTFKEVYSTEEDGDTFYNEDRKSTESARLSKTNNNWTFIKE